MTIEDLRGEYTDYIFSGNEMKSSLRGIGSCKLFTNSEDDLHTMRQ